MIVLSYSFNLVQMHYDRLTMPYRAQIKRISYACEKCYVNNDFS